MAPERISPDNLTPQQPLSEWELSGRPPSSLRDAAYELIKQRIIMWTYRPGEALSEAAVSAELGLGRTPVRQAFDRLMRDGLVEVLPRKGILVRPITQDEVRDMVEARLINECFCARQAAERIDQTTLLELQANLGAGRAALGHYDVEALMRLDRNFHAAICSSAQNVVLSDFMKIIHERSQRVWHLSLRDRDHNRRVMVEHGAIVAALGDHDADGAEAAMRAHILSFAENLGRLL
ncbi:MAG: GntR family transcriptional regulator [Xanthobacter sp.]